MSIVVSDSSPLNVLIRMGRANVLKDLFEVVVIPPQVRWELTDEMTPPEVRSFFAREPSWLRVQAPSEIRPIQSLDLGETAAIGLCIEIGADLLLIDEVRARNVALRQGLRVIGLLGVLERADQVGLLRFEEAAIRLPKDFRVHPRLVAGVARRCLTRRASIE